MKVLSEMQDTLTCFVRFSYTADHYVPSVQKISFVSWQIVNGKLPILLSL